MATPERLMPTEDDLPEIRAIAVAYSGDMNIYKITPTSGGVLVSFDRRCGDPSPALEAVGYQARRLREGLVLVTGAIDRVALLTAQIEALTAERDRLAAD